MSVHAVGSALSIDAACRGQCFLAPPAFAACTQHSPAPLPILPHCQYADHRSKLLHVCRGFTQPLINLKQRITAAHSSLPPENPGKWSWPFLQTLRNRGLTRRRVHADAMHHMGTRSVRDSFPAGSKWPKTSLGSLRDGRRLTPDELALLCAICTEESAAAFRQEPQQLQREQQWHEQQALAGGSRTGSSATPPGVTVAGATAAGRAVAEAAAAAFGGAGEADEATGIRLTVDFAAVVLFECRSLERLLSFQPVVFRGGAARFSWGCAGMSRAVQCSFCILPLQLNCSIARVLACSRQVGACMQCMLLLSHCRLARPCSASYAAMLAALPRPLGVC